MATKEVQVVVNLKPINVQSMKVTIEGTSPLIQHKWSEKALRHMREKGGGKKTKERTVREPEKEAKDATYFTDDGKFAMPLLALKSAIIQAAHKDIGIEKTLVRKGLFIKSPSASLVLPMKCSKPTVREDCVRVGMGAADLRYRPQFDEWSVDVNLEYDADLLQPSDIVNLIDRAGFGVGVCEWRPEKGGEFGRFRVRI
jgi:hypothetical protein